MDTVIRHWVTVVAVKEAAMEVFGRAVHTLECALLGVQLTPCRLMAIPDSGGPESHDKTLQTGRIVD